MRNYQKTNLLEKIVIKKNEEKIFNKCDEECCNNIYDIYEEGVDDGFEYNDFYIFETWILKQLCFFLQWYPTFSVTLFLRFNKWLSNILIIFELGKIRKNQEIWK